jgi:hypothetical protein
MDSKLDLILEKLSLIERKQEDIERVTSLQNDKHAAEILGLRQTIGLQVPTSPVFKVYKGGQEGHVESDEMQLSPQQKKTFSSTSSAPVPGKSIYPSRIVLTTYPGGASVHPLPLIWGAQDPLIRGPVVASRHPQSIAYRNAIGAHGMDCFM